MSSYIRNTAAEARLGAGRILNWHVAVSGGRRAEYRPEAISWQDVAPEAEVMLIRRHTCLDLNEQKFIEIMPQLRPSDHG